MEVIVIVTTKFGVIVTIINIICAYQKKKKKTLFVCVCGFPALLIFNTIIIESL